MKQPLKTLGLHSRRTMLKTVSMLLLLMPFQGMGKTLITDVTKGVFLST